MMLEESNSELDGTCDICKKKADVLYSQPKGSGLICSKCRLEKLEKDCPKKCCKEGEKRCRKDGS